MKPYILIGFSLKNLWSHRLRSLLTVGAVSIGVSAIVFLVALGYGLERLVTEQVANFEAFQVIDVPSANLDSQTINSSSIARLQSVNHVSQVEEVADLGGRAKLGGRESTSETVVVGVTKGYFKLSDLSFVAGSGYDGTQPSNSIVVNKSLLSMLGFEGEDATAVGQELVFDVILPENLQAEGSSMKELLGLKGTIIGVTGDAQSPMAFVTISYLEGQGLANRTSLKIKIDDRNKVAEVRQAIENIGYSTEYVGDTVSQITQVFSLFRLVLGGFGLIALIVAALGAFNTLTISLIERTREVGLLRTLGMRQRQIFAFFLSESAVIGTLGGCFGALMGMGVGAVINRLLISFAERSGAEQVTIYYAPAGLILSVLGLSFVVGCLTGLYPALRAIRMNPLDTLRYE